MAVLTNAGGPGVTAADALEANGLKLAELAAGTRLALGGLLPPAASLHNPVDMLASASPEQYSACLRLLLEDPAVHGVSSSCRRRPCLQPAAIAQDLIPVIQAAGKPVILALMGDGLILAAADLFRARPHTRVPLSRAGGLCPGGACPARRIHRPPPGPQ